MKKIFCYVLSLLITFSMVSCDFFIPDPVGTLKVKIFKIGRADCIILRTSLHTVMIDTGEQDDGEEIIEYLKKNRIEKLDYLIISHFDSDHIGGVDAILNYVEVDNFLISAYEKTTGSYKTFMRILDNHEVETTVINSITEFELENVIYTIYPPEKDIYAQNDDNNFSLCVMAKHGEKKLFFTGDSLTERIEELLKYDLKCDFLKIPNHGDYYDNLDKLFKKCNPEFSVITCSDKTTEREETYELLNLHSKNIYLTREGDILITSDGRTMTVKQ